MFEPPPPPTPELPPLPTKRTAENCYNVLCEAKWVNKAWVINTNHRKWRDEMNDRIEKEIKRIESRFKEKEKQYQESITTDEIAAFEKKFRSEVLVAENLIATEQREVANFVLNNPLLLNESTLKSDQIAELLINAAHVAPEIVMEKYNNNNITQPTSLRDSIIPLATRTDPTDTSNDVIQTEMLRNAALKFSLASPDKFFEHMPELQKVFGQKEKFENAEPNYNDISNGVRAYFREKGATKEGINEHLKAIEMNVIRMKKSGRAYNYAENLELFEHSIEKQLGKKLQNFDKNHIESEAERAHAVRLYGDRANEISLARFNATVRETVQIGAVEKDMRKNVALHIAKWMPYLKESPQAMAHAIVAYLPLNEDPVYFMFTGSPHDQLIDYLKTNPENGLKILHAIAKLDRDVILQEKFRWLNAVQACPEKIVEITLAATKNDAPEDAVNQTKYEKLPNYILKHANHFKEHPDLVVGALLAAEKHDPLAALVYDDIWRPVLSDPQMILAFDDDRRINTARSYVKTRTEHALDHITEWVPHFGKKHPEVTQEIMLELAAKEPVLTIHKSLGIGHAFTDRPKMLSNIIATAARSAAITAPIALVQNTHNWVHAFREMPEEGDRLLMAAAKTVLKTDPQAIMFNGIKLVDAYKANPKEMRDFIGEAIKKDSVSAGAHVFSWFPIYNNHPDEFMSLVNSILEEDKKKKLKEAIRKNISENHEGYPHLQNFPLDGPPQCSITPTAQHPFAAIAQRSDNPLPCADIGAGPEGRVNSPAQKLPAALRLAS